MPRPASCCVFLLAGLLAATPLAAPPALAQSAPATTALLGGLHPRSIGPAVTGGRIHDVEALPDDPATVYVATASGGLWKSVNKGTTWTSLMDSAGAYTFGDVTLAPSNPDVVWAGTGGQNNRQSTSWGNGVYRSTDGGASWTHLGLTHTRHVGRIRVHPYNPDVAYVAALGNLWAASDNRGVYKTTDGGSSWQRVLFVDAHTGVVDLAMDPSHPDVLYAAAYQRMRRAWGFNGGGPGSGLYKTTDGGTTWTRLTNGLPSGDLGRIGLGLAPSNPQTVYATLEHRTDGGVYKTTDGGASWARVNALNPRPMYYSHLAVDPNDADRLFLLATALYRSDDGGLTFRELPTRYTYDVGVHSDHHALWIDPSDPDHYYLGGDAGLHESWDGGETHSRINNLPIGQFYAIGLDHQTPYNVYGGMQDNHSWMGPSASRRWIGIINDDWDQVGFGDGMYQQPDPTNPRHVYINSQNGGLTRVDALTGDLLGLRPQPPEGETYRFDWVTPSLVSPHNPATVYFGGNRLFISHDHGNNWTATDDLTRQLDRDTLAIMGVKGADIQLSKNDGTSYFGEITTIAESPLQAGLLWVGTDDGLVQRSRDGGATWTETARNITGVPAGTYVSRVVASAAGPGVAYAAFDAHRDGDFAPYLFKTTDYGQQWTPLVEGLPAEGSVNVVVEHPRQPNLLFLGTEQALYVSTNAGRTWTRMPNLPPTTYDDLKVHPRDDDLVIGTHGRSLWVLDDLGPLAGWSAEVASAPATLFPIRAATFFHYWKATSYRGQGAYAGENKPFGALLSYHLAEAAAQVQLVIQNAQGQTLRTLEGPGGAGLIQRLAWDLRHPPPPFEPTRSERVGLVRAPYVEATPPHPLTPQGPLVAPGTYTVTLTAGTHSSTQTVVVQGDPEMPVTQAQYEAREAFLLELLALQRTAWRATADAEAKRDALRESRSLLAENDAGAADLDGRVEAATGRANTLRRIRGQLYSLAGELNGTGVRQGSLHPPTPTHRERKARLEAALKQALGDG